MKYLKRAAILLGVAVLAYTTVNISAEAINETTMEAEAIPANLHQIVSIEGDTKVDGDENKETFTREYFNNIEITGDYPPNSNYTIELENIVWKPFATITVSGVSYKTGVSFKAEVYKKDFSGTFVRVGIYSMTQDKCGNFSFDHPIGADGDYAFRIKHSSGSNVAAKVNFVAVY